MSLPRYERYKDSGVEWLGEVPEHWVVVATRENFSLEPCKLSTSGSCKLSRLLFA